MEKKDELVVKRIVSPVVELHHWDKGFIAQVNEYELLDVRVQIKEKGLKGYYVIYVSQGDSNVHHICIDKNGEMEYYPDGFYDTMKDLLLKLV